MNSMLGQRSTPVCLPKQRRIEGGSDIVTGSGLVLAKFPANVLALHEEAWS